jgi:formylglycine-generating enzyme required for sulfatase activity
MERIRSGGYGGPGRERERGRGTGRQLLASALCASLWLGACSAPAAGDGTERSRAEVMPQVLLAPDDRVPREVSVPGTNVAFRMVPVPGGSVDGREVAPFWMASTEVPWEHYLALVFEVEDRAAAEAADGFARPSRPYISIDRGFGQQDRPVISVSARAARTYCEWLSRKTGGQFRIPSVDEWRLAALGGGSSADASQAVARETAQGRSAPVASLAPSRLGLYDLVGNAAEWAQDADGPVVLGGSYRDPRARLSPLMLEAPKAAWNQSDPQIPKSTWWLADAGFPGIRVVADRLPPSAPPEAPSEVP